jgi:hypothetical protein
MWWWGEFDKENLYCKVRHCKVHKKKFDPLEPRYILYSRLDSTDQFSLTREGITMEGQNAFVLRIKLGGSDDLKLPLETNQIMIGWSRAEELTFRAGYIRG